MHTLSTVLVVTVMSISTVFVAVNFWHCSRRESSFIRSTILCLGLSDLDFRSGTLSNKVAFFFYLYAYYPLFIKMLERLVTEIYTWSILQWFKLAWPLKRNCPVLLWNFLAMINQNAIVGALHCCQSMIDFPQKLHCADFTPCVWEMLQECSRQTPFELENWSVSGSISLPLSPASDSQLWGEKMSIDSRCSELSRSERNDWSDARWTVY